MKHKSFRVGWGRGWNGLYWCYGLERHTILRAVLSKLRFSEKSTVRYLYLTRDFV
jgi:hypothetical protein